MSGIQAATALLLIAYLAGCVAEIHWIVQSDLKDEDVSNLSRESSHQLLLKQLSKRNMREMMFELRNEFYTMFTGHDFYRLVADDALNKELHAISEACLALSQQLVHMGVVNALLRTAISNGAHTAHAKSDITAAFPVIKENIEKLMQDPPAPYEEYKRLKSEALAKPLPADYKIYYYEIPKTLPEAKKILAQSLNEPRLKKLMVQSTFGNETRKQAASSPESYLLAKAILELAKDPQVGTQVQALFEEAVAESANKVEDVDASNVSEKHIRETFVEIGKDFFKTLAHKFENDAAVKTKLVEKKETISKSR